MLEGKYKAGCEVFQGVDIVFNCWDQRLQKDIEVVIRICDK